MVPKVKLVEKPEYKILNKIERLERASFGQGGLNRWQLPVIIRYGRLFILENEGQIIGVASLLKTWLHPQSAFLYSFSVEKKWRGRGLGRFFLTAIVEELKRDRVKELKLTVDQRNVVATSLYKRLGFVEKEFLPDEYGRGEDRFLLELKLIEYKDSRVFP